MLPRSRWIGGEIETRWGQRHCPNVPTEEVFTTPDRNRTEGVVSATRPVAYPEGMLVEGIRLRFSNGRIVEADADRGEEFLRSHIATDDGAAMLGEVALVGESPTGDRGVVYSHTLFDENAASHVAYGTAYATAVDGAGDLDRNALLELGLNVSTVHVDFAIGGPNVEVDAIDTGGARTPVLRGTDWVLD